MTSPCGPVQITASLVTDETELGRLLDLASGELGIRLKTANEVLTPGTFIVAAYADGEPAAFVLIIGNEVHSHVMRNYRGALVVHLAKVIFDFVWRNTSLLKLHTFVKSEDRHVNLMARKVGFKFQSIDPNTGYKQFTMDKPCPQQ